MWILPSPCRGAAVALAAPAALLALGLAVAPAADAQRPSPPPPRLIDDVRYLADDRLAGRLIGSPGADSAAAYLARRFAQVGLQAASGGWYQEFTVSRHAAAARNAGVVGAVGRNVIGILPGRDPVLQHQTVVIGAHYDHLGLGGYGALDAPDSTGRVHNGADDNASGTAALIHIAAQLAHAPPARTVVFIAFSGEEEGLLGSAAYVKDPPYPLDRTVAMINLDMVGRLRNDRLIVYGTGTATEFPALLDSLNWYAGFDLKAQGDGYGPSDQASFYAAKRPVLYLFTDLHEDYHRTTDDVSKLNVDGLKRVVDFTVGLASALGNRPGPLTFVEVPADPRAQPSMSAAAVAAAGPHGPGAAPGGSGGYGAYLGTIPDMTDAPGGVRLTGIRAGSPAERAGLRANDIITRIGAMETPDLQAMTDALRSHRPGDTVDITVLREGAPTTVRATLGTRGG
ncbi:MAG TPA: M20/M25/M40 family metallo-hydrolase [Gemmatimonadales bacterium]|nr:M20/M25/M40 family metallo-hydrolase [Gemmatimonadales bacterium]